jgi:hypothetical protein
MANQQMTPRDCQVGDGQRHTRPVPGCAILLVPIMLAALAPAIFLGLGGRSVSVAGRRARPQHTGSTPRRPVSAYWADMTRKDLYRLRGIAATCPVDW